MSELNIGAQLLAVLFVNEGMYMYVYVYMHLDSEFYPHPFMVCF